MAQRFGGKFSPPQTGATGTAGPHRSGATPWDQRRAVLLGVFAFALVIPGFQGDTRQFLLSLAAGGALLAGAWLTREGLRAAEAFASRSIARRPALPRKILGAGLTGVALALGSLAHHPETAPAAALGAAGLLLHLLSFGLDPLRDKGTEGLDTFQTDRIAKAVDAGEAHLAAMKDAILRADAFEFLASAP